MYDITIGRNESDKKIINVASLRILKNVKDNKYPDINYSDKEAEKIVSETIDDLFG